MKAGEKWKHKIYFDETIELVQYEGNDLWQYKTVHDECDKKLGCIHCEFGPFLSGEEIIETFYRISE